MLTREKKLLIAIIILLLIFATTFTIMKNNNKKLNEVNEKSNNDIVTIKKDYDLKGITISNISIYKDENGSNFTAKVENTSGNDIQIKYLTAIFYDKDNEPVIEKYFLQHANIAKDNTQYINLYNDSGLYGMIDVKFEIEYE